jgi:hypothetical protein
MNKHVSTIFSKYAQFSYPEEEKWNHRVPNFLSRVSASRIVAAEAAGGFHFPECYSEFLKKVGAGVFHLDSKGAHLDFRGNVFLNPEEVLQYVQRESPEWLTDSTYLEPGDIPFFYVGDDIVLIFRQGNLDNGAVYEQYGERPRLPSFERFLELLYDDVDLYRSAIFQD